MLSDGDSSQDTGTEASLMNRDFVLSALPNLHIQQMTSSLKIRDIGASTHESKEYIDIPIYLSSKRNSDKMTCIKRKMHIVENLKTKMLIEIDILESEGITLNVSKRVTKIDSCENMKIELKIHQRDSFVRRIVISKFVETISSEEQAKIRIAMSKSLSKNRDFIFESSTNVDVSLYAHLVNVYTIEILVQNDFADSVNISRNTRLDFVQKIEYENCFYASSNSHLTLKTSKKNWIKEAMFVVTNLNEITSRETYVNKSKF